MRIFHTVISRARYRLNVPEQLTKHCSTSSSSCPSRVATSSTHHSRQVANYIFYLPAVFLSTFLYTRPRNRAEHTVHMYTHTQHSAFRFFPFFEIYLVVAGDRRHKFKRFFSLYHRTIIHHITGDNQLFYSQRGNRCKILPVDCQSITRFANGASRFSQGNYW